MACSAVARRLTWRSYAGAMRARTGPRGEPAGQAPVEKLEEHGPDHGVDGGPRGEGEGGEVEHPDVEHRRQPLEDHRVPQGGEEKDEGPRRRAHDQEVAAPHPDRVAEQELREGREAEHGPGEVDVLHPSRGHAREHAMGLGPRERAVDRHEEEGIEQTRASVHEAAEGGLHQQGQEDSEGRPDPFSHRTLWLRVMGAFTFFTTSTSSTWSKRAEGSTRISLKRPAPFPTDLTRPTTSPLG